jgi:bifunctional non-homologous end joining protein LigD
VRVAADGTTVLTSRNGIDFTDEFVSLVGVLDEALDGRAAVFDGEIVTYNDSGLVDFGLMQERRGRYQKHRTSVRRDLPFEDVPVRLLLFDLLMLDGQSLLNQSYDQRRELLTGIPMPDPYRISIVPAFTFADLAADRLTPERLLERVAAEGQEGLVARHCPAPYVPGRRTDAWRKRAITHTQEVIICGWRPGQSRLAGTLGGLLLGAHDPDTGDLVYLGDGGRGTSER